MAVKYCSGCGPYAACDCEHPLMVHRCGFEGGCGVEIYNSDEMCERHTADTGFLARGGPVNIANDEFNKVPSFWYRFWYGK